MTGLKNVFHLRERELDRFLGMKVLTVNFSGSRGGASIAARRLHQALLDEGLQSELWCARDPDDVHEVRVLHTSFQKKLNSAKNILVQKLVRRMGYNEERSFNFFRTPLIQQINASDADVVHFHWINAEMVRIEQLKGLKKPVVWTFHDMWPFCGAEHYTDDTRYEIGYSRARFIDVDRWVFRRKVRAWRALRIHIICPSNWLGSCVKRSALMHASPVSVIPNCLNMDRFKPVGESDRKTIREKFGISEEKRVLLFGAVNAKDVRKGGDLIAEALSLLADKEKYVVVVFGHGNFENMGGIETICAGTVSGDAALEELYSCADLFCIPSRQDNLPNTILEALSCGVPAVGFYIGGLPDLIDDRENGRLVAPFDTKAYALAIAWCFSDGSQDESGNRMKKLRKKARLKAEQSYAPDIVVEQVRSVYRQVLS
jgi:glycosyltransferase involved in cell wall biosynthesis